MKFFLHFLFTMTKLYSGISIFLWLSFLMIKNILNFILILMALLLPISALAEEVRADDYGNIEFIDGGRDALGEHWVQIVFHLNSHWKTYWQYPGQNGLAPILDLTGSRNISDFEQFWSPPWLVGDKDIAAVGYENSASLILRLVAQEPNEAVVLNLSAQFGVCEHICIPLPYDLQKTLSVDEKIDAKILSKRAKEYLEIPLCELAPDWVLTRENAADLTGHFGRFEEASLPKFAQYGVAVSGICQIPP